MATNHSPEPRVHIESNARKNIAPSDVEQLIEIALVYFPDYEETSKLLRHHIQCADSLRIARRNNNVIVGFSIASRTKRLTPFYPRPICLLYQRMLYLSPDILYKGLGKRLLTATFRDLLGPLWPFRRFALVCRTLNPVVARMMDMHTISYPHFGEDPPREIKEFGESLLPMFDARELDEQYRLLGTLDAFKNVDYTEIWNRHLHKHVNSYERLMLNSAFTETNGRIINNGSLIFMVAYSKPLQFIRFLFR
jgi:hypothetical protein